MKRTIPLVAIGLIGVLSTVKGADVLADPGEIEQDMPREFQIDVAKDGDLVALRNWAELRCRGWTLQDLAASLGVAPSVDAVAAHLARNLSPESRQVVEETCRGELEKAAET